jgi:hypothetical protein
VIQLLAIIGVVVAAAVAAFDSAAARVVSVVLIGLIAVVALKLALVSLSLQQRLGVGTDRRSVAASSDELHELQSRIAEFSTRAQMLTDEVEPMVTLTRRTEPAIAELATLRHEVLYLREAVDRIERFG